METMSGFHEYAFEYLDSRYYEEAYLREDIMFDRAPGLFRYDRTYDEPSLLEDNVLRDMCVTVVQATRPSAVGAVGPDGEHVQSNVEELRVRSCLGAAAEVSLHQRPHLVDARSSIVRRRWRRSGRRR